MFELKITQCQVGKFNLCSSEENLSFYLVLLKDGVIYEEDGVKAILYYSGEPEEKNDFENAIENLELVFEKCFQYANSIISSTNYKAQCILFAKTYQENWKQIDTLLLARYKEKVQKEIERFQRELDWNTIVPNIYYAAKGELEKEIQKYKRFRDSENKKLEQLKEDNPKYTKCIEQIESYNKRLIYLTQQIATLKNPEQ